VSSDTPSSPDWRDDPGWRPVQYDPSLCDAADIPKQPTAHAELSTSPIWASLYEGNRIVVTWYRPSVSPTTPRATMVVDE
jgi:hypothetical protein